MTFGRSLCRFTFSVLFQIVLVVPFNTIQIQLNFNWNNLSFYRIEPIELQNKIWKINAKYRKF